MNKVLILIVFLGLTAGASHAQKLDIEAIKRDAASAADEFAELRALMRDQDANLRLAAFDAMVTNGDPSLYEIATSMAIADVDEVVRSRALWEILSRMRTMAILIDPEEKVTDSENQKALQNAYQGRMSFQVGNALKDLNCVNLYYVKDECVGGYNLAVNGTRVTFVYANQNLDGTLKLEGDGALRGVFRNTRLRLEFPVEVPLR
ncbi:HEAT repeat domain-containing protein [uncultured Roseobacter sp.]|uniref:HEAT repeat domain-containing protein n=1 Tax=uncultured Roseobacter sp. TaxID=114847 RepID=UPI0026155179|nr:HEAT repeat domain-containing protein [uncultured Roseobacter sp.]